MSENTFYGFDELRNWLETQGFRCYYNNLIEQGNKCNWYACRKTKLKARECETNDNSAVQITIRPFKFEIFTNCYKTIEIELVGEANKIWFSLKAYALTEDDVYKRLDEIEQMLVSAWNGLMADEHINNYENKINELEEELKEYRNHRNWTRPYDYKGNLIPEHALYKPKIKK